MKKFSRIAYLLIMALFVLSLSGCGSDTHNNFYEPETEQQGGTGDTGGNSDGTQTPTPSNNTPSNNTPSNNTPSNNETGTATSIGAPSEAITANSAAIITALGLAEGTTLTVLSTDTATISTNTTAPTTAAAVLPSVSVATTGVYTFGVDLSNLSADTAIYWNAGTGNAAGFYYSAATASGSALFYDDDAKQVTKVPANKHVNVVAYFVAGTTYAPYITTTAASTDSNTSNNSGNTGTSIDAAITITLNYDSATVSGEAVTAYDYVWHIDPDHNGEYFTAGINGEEVEDLDESYPVPSNGIYIAHDIAYTPNTLEFTTSQTAVKDEDTEYVVYYSDEVCAEAAENDGLTSGKYILATLPMSAGQGMPGGNPGGEMPNGGQGGTTPPDGGQGGTTPPDGGQGGTTPPDGGQGGGRPGGQQPVSGAATDTSSIATFATMTHSASDAYNNPVLHITKSGTYRLQGKWHGQIWVDTSDEDGEGKVTLILDGVEVSCDVAPAIVFYETLYECGSDDEDEMSSDAPEFTALQEAFADAGAKVIIADGTTNSFTGANVYRIMKAKKKSDSVTAVTGSDISLQKKMYKMDAAFYSFVSIVFSAESSSATGTLNITSTTYEGLDAELHMLVESGKINVTAEDDGINVNEDNVSVFMMNGGTLNVTTKGGDGIDSNGWIDLNAGTLHISAASDTDETNARAEGPLDADMEVYIADEVNYTHSQYTGN